MHVLHFLLLRPYRLFASPHVLLCGSIVLACFLPYGLIVQLLLIMYCPAVLPFLLLYQLTALRHVPLHNPMHYHKLCCTVSLYYHMYLSRNSMYYRTVLYPVQSRCFSVCPTTVFHYHMSHCTTSLHVFSHALLQGFTVLSRVQLYIFTLLLHVLLYRHIVLPHVLLSYCSFTT